MPACSDAHCCSPCLAWLPARAPATEAKAKQICANSSGREYRQGHIPGAIHIPFWQTFFRTDSLTAAGDDTVVVTCAHGPRAGVGKLALQLAGFRNVVYLDGHMSGWYKAGLPVVPGTD